MKRFLDCLILMVVCFGAGAFVQYRQTPSRMEVVEVESETLVPLSIDANYLLRVVAQMESGGTANPHLAMRFEPHHQNRKECKGKSHQQLCATSIGEFQVMGWHAVNRGLHPSILFDPQTNREIALEVLDDCFRRNRKQLKETFKCYNGSDSYAEKATRLLLGEIVK